jgi:hypothetical protein
MLTWCFPAFCLYSWTIIETWQFSTLLKCLCFSNILILILLKQFFLPLLLVSWILGRRQLTNEFHGGSKGLKKIIFAQLVKKFPSLYVTWRVITMFTSQPLGPILNQLNPAHILFKIHFNIILPNMYRSHKSPLSCFWQICTFILSELWWKMNYLTT